MNLSSQPTITSHPYTPHCSAEEAVNYLDSLLRDMDAIKSILFDFVEEFDKRKGEISPILFAIRRVEHLARDLKGHNLKAPYLRDAKVFEAWRHTCEAWKRLAYLQRGLRV